MRELAGKVAVVAGVGNLGLALARRFARERMRVVLADIDAEALAASEAALRAEGATVLAIPTDVSQLDEVQALADRTVEALGAVHVLCNNVGANPRSRNLWEATDADWRWTVDANLWGTVHAVRVFVPIMLAQDTEGHVVNTSTIPGLGSRAGNSPYVVTKAAVITLTEVLHHELMQIGAKVRASVLVPGRIAGGIAKSQRPPRYRLPGDEQRIEEERRRYEARLKEREAEPADEFAAPDAIADQVCDAIRSERFYILTHRGPTARQVRARAEAIASDGVPPLFHG
jgi:NAD(P)-dependent dehydrogenase (short-subunit alcohol dehydrogenase family)